MERESDRLRSRNPTVGKEIDTDAAKREMDLKAGLITEKEYEKVKDSVMEVKVGKSREMER